MREIRVGMRFGGKGPCSLLPRSYTDILIRYTVFLPAAVVACDSIRPYPSQRSVLSRAPRMWQSGTTDGALND